MTIKSWSWMSLVLGVGFLFWTFTAFTQVQAQAGSDEVLADLRSSTSEAEVIERILLIFDDPEPLQSPPAVLENPDLGLTMTYPLSFSALHAYTNLPSEYLETDTWILNALVKLLVEHHLGMRILSGSAHGISRSVLHKILMNKSVGGANGYFLMTIMESLGWQKDFEFRHKGDGGDYMFNSISPQERLRRSRGYRLASSLIQTSIVGGGSGLAVSAMMGQDLLMGSFYGALGLSCAWQVMKFARAKSRQNRDRALRQALGF